MHVNPRAVALTIASLAFATTGCSTTQSTIPAADATASHAVAPLSGGGGTGGGTGGGGGGGGRGILTLKGRVVADPGSPLNGNLTYFITINNVRELTGTVNRVPLAVVPGVIAAVDRNTGTWVNWTWVQNLQSPAVCTDPCGMFPAEGVNPNLSFGPNGIGPVVSTGDVLDVVEIDPAFVAAHGGFSSVVNGVFVEFPFNGGAPLSPPWPISRHLGSAVMQ